MRASSRWLGALVIGMVVAAYGCGGGGSSPSDASSADAKDAKVPDSATDKASDTRGADAPDGAGDADGDAKADAPGGDAKSDATTSDSSTDGAAPTCTDGIKNGDETGIDCGGRCGKCQAGDGCKVAVDCQFELCRSNNTCAACLVASDCPGGEDECKHRTCTAGVCGTAMEMPGKVLALQTAGDCKRRVCGNDGKLALPDDPLSRYDQDLPDDMNPCTQDICTMGVPSHTMLPAGTSCGGANQCNAGGQCVGCSVATDCPGTDTVCRTRTCSSAGVCGVSFVSSGTKLTDPTVKDCKGMACDGNGNSGVVNDDTDKPDDGNACTSDLCSGGVPSHSPVASGTSCGGSLVCDGANKCVECLGASSCPGSDSECQRRTCVSGACGINLTTAGTLVAAQTAKDCKKNQCNGMGSTPVTVPDDTDVPNDGNPCTADVCAVGMPSNPPVSSRTSCGGSSICDGQGACVACIVATDCPGSDTECHTRTCVSGVCGVSNKMAGTAVLGQASGDCKKNQCDGAGAQVTVTDDSDLPVDGKTCTMDVCASGTPSNPPVGSGVSCGTNQLCDGQGACVGCLMASDCAGSDTACQTRTCVNNQCGVSNVGAGMAIPTQTAGDCKKDQCDGAGHITTVVDDTDKPVDGNSCTQDVCTMGVKSNPPVAAGATCSQGGGARCNGSDSAPACVQCLMPTDCSGSDTECHVRTCSAAGACGVNNTMNGQAVSGQVVGDCKKNVCNGSGVVTSINDDGDVLDDGNVCTQDVCMSGVASHPPVAAGTTCSQGGGSRCNGSVSAPACVQCLAATDCPGSDTACNIRTCIVGVCGTSNINEGGLTGAQPAGDCLKNVCIAGAVASATDSADVPVDGNPCTQDICTGDVPSNPLVASGTTCNVNGGSVCNAGACVQCVAPTNCPGGPDTACQTRTCSEAGVCGFDRPSNGTLVTNVPAGNCHKDVCDGAGNTITVIDNDDVLVDGNACTQDLCMAGVASNPPEDAGTPCGTGGTFMCNGSSSAPACVECVSATTCPGADTACQQRTCAAGVCGFHNENAGTPVTNLPAGDCHHDECDGAGNIAAVIDDTDVPTTTNQCLQAVCMTGTPSNPPAPVPTACNQSGGTQCDGAGACVGCVSSTTCPGSDAQCHTRTCNTNMCDTMNADSGTLCNENGGTVCNGSGTCVQCVGDGDCNTTGDPPCSKTHCVSNVCTLVPVDVNTPIADMAPGDCHSNVCDGVGGVSSPVNDADVPADSNTCTQDLCTGGVPSNPAVMPGTSCSQSGGTRCDVSATCVRTFMVARIGDSTVPALTSAATPVFVEERFVSDGTVHRIITVPSSGTSPKPVTLSGSADSEGALTLSGDGHSVVIAGYSAAAGTTGVASSAATSIPRAAALIGADGTVDTSTTLGTVAFTANNVRSAVTNNGMQFWAGGNGSGATRGVFYANTGAITSTLITSTTNSTRVCEIAFGQLYCTAANGSIGIAVIGSSLPTAAATQAPLSGTAFDVNASYYAFVFLDLVGNDGLPDTLYTADDRTNSSGGIQKWIVNGSGTWGQVWASNGVAGTSGFRGLTGYPSAGGATLIATALGTSPTPNAIVRMVDTGPTPTSANVTTLVPASGVSVFRGVALAPQ